MSPEDELSQENSHRRDQIGIEERVKNILHLEFEKSNKKLLEKNPKDYWAQAKRESTNIFETLRADEEKYKRLKKAPREYERIKKENPREYESIKNNAIKYQTLLVEVLNQRITFCDGVTPSGKSDYIGNFLEIEDGLYKPLSKSQQRKSTEKESQQRKKP